jgi:TonB family protein
MILLGTKGMKLSIRWGLAGLFFGVTLTGVCPARAAAEHAPGKTGPHQMPSKYDKPPKLAHSVRPEYPMSQRRAGFKGEVVVQFVVEKSGQVRNPYVVRSTNPAFDQPAIKAILQWRFKPAEKDGRPVECRMQLPIIFQLEGGGADAFTVQTSKKFQKSLPPGFQFDTAPKLLSIQPAVYPFAELLAKRRGTVEFSFAVNTRGHAVLVKVYESPGEAFTGAVQAMLDVMRFKPALKAGKPANALLSMSLDFDGGSGEVPVSDAAEDLLRSLRRPGKADEFATAAHLDAPIHPLSQRPPVFPNSLRGKLDHGAATVEFFIDEYGMAELPRIVSASDPAFGYAACQAVAAWRFEPAERAGRTVPVSVQVPFEFNLK